MEALTISHAEVALRLVVTFVLCGIIGFEREIRDQPAGFRTHILLGLGASLFTLVSAYGFPAFTEAALDEGGIQFDPTRITAQVVTGVGFLGAGAIIRQGLDIRGLTTAASLWTAAAIGLAAGAGYLFGAFLTTVIVLVALYLLRMFGSTVIPRFRTDFATMEAVFSGDGEGISDAVHILERHGMKIRTIDAEMNHDETRYSVQFRIPPGCNVHETLREIAALDAVRRVGVTGLHDID